MTGTRLDPLIEVSRLADEFRRDAPERDLAAGTPKNERDRIRASGLLQLMIPRAYGGLEAPWPIFFRAVRELASADASLAHLFAYHHLGVITPHLIGTPAQRERWYARSARDNLFWGNSLNPLDSRTTLTRTADGSFRLGGEKSFCTGASDSDLLLVSANLPGETPLQVMVLPTGRDGITVNDDWDNMGQRQTDSGSVSFRNVRVEADELLGPPGSGGSVFATLRACIVQSILSNIFGGLAQGAFDEARSYARGLQRPFAGSTASEHTQDPYVVERFGEMSVQIQSAVALLDRAADVLEAAWHLGDDITAEQRGQCAVSIAAAKVASGRTALDVTSAAFEVMGARATSARYRFDRFWRNARTLTLHDPLDYKVREVGDWALNGRFPTPSFYS